MKRLLLLASLVLASGCGAEPRGHADRNPPGARQDAPADRGNPSKKIDMH